MVNDESSPDPEISVRSPHASLPSFAGLALPSPLRELRNQHVGDAPATPQPSDFTALAVRLRKIHLDTSPTDSPPHSENTPSPAHAAKPLRLDFDQQEKGHDKENVDNRATALDSGKPPKTPKRKVKEHLVGKATSVQSDLKDSDDAKLFVVRGSPEDDTVDEIPVAVAHITEPTSEIECPNDDRRAKDAFDVPEILSDESETYTSTDLAEREADDAAHPEVTDLAVDVRPDAGISARAETDAPEAEEISDPSAEEIETKIEPAEIEAEGTQHATVEDEVDQAIPRTGQGAPTSADAEEFQQQVQTASSKIGGEALDVIDVREAATSQDETLERERPKKQDDPLSRDAQPNAIEGTVGTSVESEQPDPISVPSNKETEVTSLMESEFHVDVGETAAVGPSDEIRRTTTKPAPSDSEGFEEDLTIFRKQFQIILEGKEKWSWPTRCEAMSTVAQTLMASPSQGVISVVREAIANLSNAVSNNLDELRPSIITSALSLVNSVLSSKADDGSDFAEEVFPSVMDLSCGRSLTAREAARCVALVLDFHPDLSIILEDADNPDRLIELLQLDIDEDNADPEIEKRAKQALALARKIVSGVSSEDALSRDHGRFQTKPKGPTQDNTTPKPEMKRAATLRAAAASENAMSMTESAENGAPPPSGPSGKNIYLAAVEGRTSRHHRFSERVGPISSSDFKATARQSLRANMSDIRLSTPLVRNKKLGDSIRKVTPNSSRLRRMYTEEDMEEARNGAIRVAMEETSQREAKMRAQHQEERAALEKSLRKEKSEVAELKCVLEEYELTMQKMVAQGNSQASAYCASLEKETKKLKAELLEVTEAYENVKERYDASKQAMIVYENKETRFIEQIRALKKSMTELQNWSDDLKANCEKKLAKAFDQVTTYRASFMEAEAHRDKAATDVERIRTDLAKEAAKHAETAASLSRLEVSLHEEQDNRSSLEASLSSAKDSLARLTSQKDRLQREVSSSQEELRKTTAKLSELQDAETRATNASKQLETYTAERQSLKARAYDDMTRIRAFENELEVKDKEYQELNAICEEALSQLEKMKLQEK